MVPLELTLYPIVDSRAPARDESQETFGYRLRLADGPLVRGDDPLLTAFGATVVSVEGSEEHEETLQAASFDPGRWVRFVHEGDDDDGDAIVGVWDGEGLRPGGTLPFRTAAIVAAGLEYGLEIRGLVLREERARRDDRRVEVQVLIFNAALLRVADADSPFGRPARPTRRRIVLFADGSSDLRLWDPSGTGGPITFDELPMSVELREALHRLKEAFSDAADQEELDTSPDFEQCWNRSSLDDRARTLWRRARGELGRSYAVGLLGRGMRMPVWSPEEVHDDGDDDDDFPF